MFARKCISEKENVQSVTVVYITIRTNNRVIMNRNTVNQAALIQPVIVGGLRWTLITQKSALKVTYTINNVHLIKLPRLNAISFSLFICISEKKIIIRFLDSSSSLWSIINKQLVNFYLMHFTIYNWQWSINVIFNPKYDYAM